LFKIVANYKNSCNNLSALYKLITVHVNVRLDRGTETDTVAEVSRCQLRFMQCIQITGIADTMLPTCRLLLPSVTSVLKPKYQCISSSVYNPNTDKQQLLQKLYCISALR